MPLTAMDADMSLGSTLDSNLSLRSPVQSPSGNRFMDADLSFDSALGKDLTSRSHVQSPNGSRKFESSMKRSLLKKSQSHIIRSSPQSAPKARSGEATGYMHLLLRLFQLYDLRGTGEIQEDAFYSTQSLIAQIVNKNTQSMSFNPAPAPMARPASPSFDSSSPKNNRILLSATGSLVAGSQSLSKSVSWTTFQPEVVSPAPTRSPSFSAYATGVFTDFDPACTGSLSKEVFVSWQQRLFDASSKSYATKRTRLEWLVDELWKMDGALGRSKAWREREAVCKQLQVDFKAADALRQQGALSEAVEALQAALQKAETAGASDGVELDSLTGPQSLFSEVQHLRQSLRSCHKEMETRERRESRLRSLDAAEAEAAALADKPVEMAARVTEAKQRLKSASVELAELNAELRNDLGPTLSILERAGKEVQMLIHQDIQALASLHVPVTRPCQIFAQVLCTLLQEEAPLKVNSYGKRYRDYWARTKTLLMDPPTLLRRIRTLDTDGMLDSVIQRLDKIDFKLHEQQACSNEMFFISVWVKALISHQHACSKVRAKLELLQQLTDNFHVAEDAVKIFQRVLWQSKT